LEFLCPKFAAAYNTAPKTVICNSKIWALAMANHQYNKLLSEIKELENENIELLKPKELIVIR
jgi:DNA-binding transcriptional regulator PaaX